MTKRTYVKPQIRRVNEDTNKHLICPEKLPSIHNSNNGNEQNLAAEMMVKFQSYKEGVVDGELFSLYYQKTFSFKSLDQMLIIMEDIMDAVGFPKASTVRRGLLNTDKSNMQFRLAELSEKDLINDFHSAAFSKLYDPSLLIRVINRQNASIQGLIIIKGFKVFFRSGMELMRLIHEYISRHGVCNY